MSVNKRLTNIAKISLVVAITTIGLFFAFNKAQSITSPSSVTAIAGAVGDNLNCADDLSPAGQEIFCGGQGELPASRNILQVIIDNIVTIMVGLIGAVLAVVILVSAVQIVTAGGSPDAMKSAKGRLAQAAISLGLLIAFRAIIALIGVA